MNESKENFSLRTIGVIMVVALLLIGGASIAKAAAQAAIPGDALYPVKTTIEQTQLTLAQDAGDRAEMRMTFAEQRLGEIAALISEGRHREIGPTVLAFEGDINSAILELETVSEIDPSRAAQIALEITATLSRYAQTLTGIAANAPDIVKQDVVRALDTTNIVGSLELPTTGLSSDDNSNFNGNANDNGDDDSMNANGDDNLANSNDNGDDKGANTNDDTGTNTNDDAGNVNSNDDSSANANGNDVSNSNDDGNANNTSSDDGNTNDDNSANSNADDGSNGNTNDDSSNSNSDNGGANSSDDGGNANNGGNPNGNGNDDNANNNGDD